MNIITTKDLFQEVPNRLELAYELVKQIFPNLPPEAIRYELLRQGLLQHGEQSLNLDVWKIIEQEATTLQNEWQGPTVPIYIFPIADGFIKNGIAYKNAIFLFISNQLTPQQLQALLTHEYHHICRRNLSKEPLTLLDSILMEGLAEDAVETRFGKEALSPWTERYSLKEVLHFWNTQLSSKLHQIGLQNHQVYLYGDPKIGLPKWIGYCTGFRIVQAFKTNYGPISTESLLSMSSEDILKFSGFEQKENRSNG